MSELLSVIIPVYNVEKYLESCVQSVINQTWKNLEIILVDDGSTDNSPTLCDRLASSDCRIKVIHKKNEGLGYTRNCALQYANGDYISFLDSDDTLDLHTYETCIHKMKEVNADACYFGRKTFDSEGNYTVNTNIPDKLLYRGDEIAKEYSKHYIGWLQNEQKYPYIRESACCALYRGNIIREHNLIFPSERECLSEDAFFNMDICRLASTILIIPENFYNYRYNPNSLTTKYDQKKFEKTVGYYTKLKEYILKFPEVQDAKERVDYKFFSLTRAAIIKVAENSRISEWRSVLATIRMIISRMEVLEAASSIDLGKVDRNTRIFAGWVKNKQAFLIYIFYKVRSLLA